MKSKNKTNNKYGFLMSASGKVVLFIMIRNIWGGTQISEVKKNALFGEVSSEMLVRH